MQSRNVREIVFACRTRINYVSLIWMCIFFFSIESMDYGLWVIYRSVFLESLNMYGTMITCYESKLNSQVYLVHNLVSTKHCKRIVRISSYDRLLSRYFVNESFNMFFMTSGGVMWCLTKRWFRGFLGDGTP